MHEAYGVKYWTHALGVSKEELHKAVDKGGNSAATVRKQLASWASAIDGLAMIDTRCKICFGLGWVCENHPRRAWSAELGCQCGAGMPCECQDDLDRGGDPVIVEIVSEETRH